MPDNLKEADLSVFIIYKIAKEKRAINEYIPRSEEITLYGGYSQRNIKNGKKYTILVNLK